MCEGAASSSITDFSGTRQASGPFDREKTGLRWSAARAARAGSATTVPADSPVPQTASSRWCARGTAILLTAAVVLIGAPGASAADIAGWQQARWGMSETDLSRAFGSRLQPLGGQLAYDGAVATRGIEGVSIGGIPFRAVFQMSGTPPRLSQVLLQPSGRPAPERLLRPVHDALRDELGPPSAACVTPRADGGPLSVEIVWRSPTTTAHLSFFDFRSGAIAGEDPNVDPDPLTPYYKTRRNNQRFLPQRILIRYHATARDDLMSDCRPKAP